jgi:hypothetical protein
MIKLDPSHRCYGQPPQILVSNRIKPMHPASPMRRVTYYPWHVSVADGVQTFHIQAHTGLSPDYFKLAEALSTAKKLQSRGKWQDWPIWLYYGGTSFATHERYLIADDADAILHILMDDK